jgi:hypothetical protein
MQEAQNSAEKPKVFDQSKQQQSSTQVNMPKKGIFILSAARSTSTTLLKIFQQLIEQNIIPLPSPSPSSSPSSLASPCDHDPSLFSSSRGQCQVFLEPFSQPYYLENNLTATPGFTFQQTLPQTFSDALSHLIAHSQDPQNIFLLVKDLGHQCQDLLHESYSKEFDLLLEYYQFLFLVRSPAETILSGYHQYAIEGQGHLYHASDVGMTQLKHLFDLIERKTGQTPLVLDANDYLEDPEIVLASYFQALGYPFRKEFLSWQPMSDEEVANNAYYRLWGDAWYGVLRKSSGLQKKEKRVRAKEEESETRASSSASASSASATAAPSISSSRYPYSLDLPPLKEILETELPSYLEIISRGTHPPSMDSAERGGG